MMHFILLDIVLLKNIYTDLHETDKAKKEPLPLNFFFFFTCFKVSPFTIPIDSGGLSLGLQTDKFHFQIHTQQKYFDNMLLRIFWRSMKAQDIHYLLLSQLEEKGDRAVC